MTTKTQARAPARALVGAAAFGSLAGLAIGCAYLGGEAARASMIRAKAERFAEAANAGYSEPSLVAAAGGSTGTRWPSRGAMIPTSWPGGAGAPQAASSRPRIAARAGQRQRGPARQRSIAPTPASPFRMVGALDASRDLQCLTEAVYWEARGEGATAWPPWPRWC